jgi:probable phosphoglycerate mutase
LQVQQHAGLREREIGVLQGLTRTDAPFKQPEAWAVLQSGEHSARIPGGGESLDDLRQRLTETLLDIAAQHPGDHFWLLAVGLSSNMSQWVPVVLSVL